MTVHRSAEYWSLGIDFLAAGNYIAVNRSLIKVFGLDGAVLIGELASEAKYWNDRDKLEDGWFFSTIENIEEATGLSGYQQRKALAELKSAGVIETSQKGIPKKRYIRIHFMELVNLVNDKSSKNFTTVGKETSPLEDEKLDTNNYKEQLEQTTTRTNKGTSAKKPPTIEEVKAHVKEKGYHFDPQHFFDYYEASGWHFANGRPVKSWKQCCVTWEGRWKDSNPQPTGRLSDYNFAGKQETITVTDDAYDWSGYDDIRF
jgi:hypothetical protein